MYYVTMTDKFLTGWGEAQGRKAKFIYECETYSQAEVVANNARSRGDQSHVNICIREPRYNSRFHLVQWKTIDCSPNWYQPGYFKGVA